MARRPPAPPSVPPKPSSLAVLKRNAARCTACDLYKRGTQTVFGEGPASARVIIVGEQPGDDEDIAGRPFVGPAGRLLSKALAEAGIERERVYVTNAVKHFKWIYRGKRRLHQKPAAAEIEACRPWLEGEIRAIGPAIVVCLGKTAAESVLQRAVAVMKERGRFVPFESAEAFVTVHPSSILRIPDEARRQAYADFVKDLRAVARRSKKE